MSKAGADGSLATSSPEPVIVVCLRPADPAARVDPLSGRVVRDPGMLDLPPAEAAALEYGLRVAEAWSGRVLAVTAADESAEDALRQVAALGAGVLRVPWPAGAAAHGPGAGSDEEYVAELARDERALAAALAAAIRAATGPAGPALVLTGDRSADRGTGALPAYLAHELGAAQALGLVALEAADDHLVAERRLDGGRRERLAGAPAGRLLGGGGRGPAAPCGPRRRARRRPGRHPCSRPPASPARAVSWALRRPRAACGWRWGGRGRTGLGRGWCRRPPGRPRASGCSSSPACSPRTSRPR